MGDKWQRALPVPGAGPDAGPAAPLAVQPRHRRGPRGAVVGQHHRIRHDQPRLRRPRYRYTYAATGKPGWFLFDGLVQARPAYRRARNATRSATACTAARPRWRRARGGGAEDDGYLVTLTTDMNADASYCLVFDAARVADGPVCNLALPERISSGTHSTWAPGSDLRRWRQTDSAAAAIGL